MRSSLPESTAPFERHVGPGYGTRPRAVGYSATPSFVIVPARCSSRSPRGRRSACCARRTCSGPPCRAARERSGAPPSDQLHVAAATPEGHPYNASERPEAPALLPAASGSSRRDSRAHGSRCRNPEAFLQVVGNAQSVCHDGQRRVDGAAGGKEAAIHDVEVIQVVRATVPVERRGLRIVAKANGAVLMRHPGERNAISHKEVSREQA